MSTDMETESISTTAGEDVPKTTRKLFVNEPIPESPRSSHPTNSVSVSNNDAGALTDGPSHNPDKQVDEEQPSPALTTAQPTQETSATDSTLAFQTSTKGSKAKHGSALSTFTRSTATARAGSAPTAIKTAPKTSVKTTAATKPTATMANRADVKPVTKPQSAVKKSTTTSTKPPTTTRKPAAVKVSQDSGTGFVKPKVKSPTKPVALPSSLTAPTASSVSKGGNVKPTASKQSGSLQPPTTARAPSRATAAGTATRTVKRKPSTINSSGSSRPSIGPPPKKNGQDGQVPKKESHVDEGFLARMMRPTQSSSSKTTEKAPATPPRKSAHRASTSTAEASSRRGSSVKRQARMKISSGDVAVSSNVSEGEPSVLAAEPDRGPDKVSLAQVEGPESASIEPKEAATIKKSDLEISLEEMKLADQKQSEDSSLKESTTEPATGHVEPLPIDKAALETAQDATVEEVLDVAEESQAPIHTPAEPAEPAAILDAALKGSEPPAELTRDASEPCEEITEKPADESAEGETAADKLVPSADSFASDMAPILPTSNVAEQEQFMEEDGRLTQVAHDEKEEAVIKDMIPAGDIIPEETAAVQTAEEVAAIAEAGGLVQTHAKPDASDVDAEDKLRFKAASSSEQG